MFSHKCSDFSLSLFRNGLLLFVLSALAGASSHAVTGDSGAAARTVGTPDGAPAAADVNETERDAGATPPGESSNAETPGEEPPDETNPDPAAGAGPEQAEDAGDAASGEDAGSPAPEAAPLFASVKEAMVAVRGDARVGMGVIVMIDDRPVVLTTLSALDGNRRMVVNTAEGEILPITGIVGAMDQDLAMLIVGEGEWPTAELRRDARIEKGGTTTVFLPQGEEPVTVEDSGGNRLKVKSPETPIYPGAPVASGGAVLAVFSPERNVQGMGTTEGSKIEPIWSDGIVPVPSIVQWEAIDLPAMASEREDLRENARIIREAGAFLGTGSKDTAVSLQPLVSARDRLGSSLRRGTQEVERNSARRSFIHSVGSVIGGVESDLTGDLETFYSYYVPEIRAMLELYRPIGKKLDQLARNPRAADSFAR